MHRNNASPAAADSTRSFVAHRRPRTSSRPSTAPSSDEYMQTPSFVGPSKDIKFSLSLVQGHEGGYSRSGSRESFSDSSHIPSSGARDVGYDSSASLAHLHRFPSFADSGPRDNLPPISQDEQSVPRIEEYDWATFITAYAAGRWDPHKTPNPPRSWQQCSLHHDPLRHPSTDPFPLGHREESQRGKAGVEGSKNTLSDELAPTTAALDQIPPAARPPTLVIPASAINRGFALPLQLPSPSHRTRANLSTSLPNASFNPSLSHISGSTSNSDVQATAAAMRWAAARIDISPLALPSPEHELTDPMRGVTASIPGCHPPPYYVPDYAFTPGGTRRSRLSGFWEGATDVEAESQLEPRPIPKPTLSAVLEAQDPVPEDIQPDAPQPLPAPSVFPPSIPFAPASAPAATMYHDGPLDATDYFGDVGILPDTLSQASVAPATALQVISREENSLPDSGTLSAPALPRRLCLTRQSSSPLPETVSRETQFINGRDVRDSVSSIRHGKAMKEEQMFQELGYLAPPNPPEELERRRALYKFNIWNTGPDMNFDRIAHLSKLVFNTKGVIISLIDTHEQWFKSEWGIKTPSCARAHSFCGHTILQRGEEPMVVLDTHKDWRFAKNPLVLGTPHLRFYAGAPLRTQDGFNIGTLSVIDDQPREDFSPRQLHTLKEFAAIAMREMELWRDKIQLRIRDRIQNSMEQFSRECLEIDTDIRVNDLTVGTSMDKVYDRAAKLVKRTLDVEGVIVMDVAHCEVLESMNSEGAVSVTLHHGDSEMDMTRRQLTTEEYHKLDLFFDSHPDGKVSEGIMPPCFRPFLPTHIQYALIVPIFNIDKRPFALICAYNISHHTKRFLEGHELSYLRAIGVIILSAVLKRRMILADKAKGLFISNISHELRTPLHGILAAAELLDDSDLNHSQASFLHTIQACGTSLVETVNHVLDFTKLSGNSKAGGVENIIVPTYVDLLQLVEEAVDGCWIGHRARTANMGDSGIGSVYSPPRDDDTPVNSAQRKHVETVIDISYRREGWTLKCEKGGIRRVLMNLFGNSLKFTSDGYVHVVLRQQPPAKDDPPNTVRVEILMRDTGKGISQSFLKNQLFHPFSQENPLQTGTGLGLAIVSNIITSDHVNGKVDVCSEEGVGTDITVTFPAEMAEGGQDRPPALEMQHFPLPSREATLPTISLIGFQSQHTGVQLLRSVISNYLTAWWGFRLEEEYGDIHILNEDAAVVDEATERRDTSIPFIILSSARGNPTVMAIASGYEKMGGFCRILYKPCGPGRLRAVLKLALHCLLVGKIQISASVDSSLSRGGISAVIPRRNSQEPHGASRSQTSRPTPLVRATTAYPSLPHNWVKPPTVIERGESSDTSTVDDKLLINEGTSEAVTTVNVGANGTLLASSIGVLDAEKRFRVLVVEDNNILRNLLIKWLSTKGYDFKAAVDGREGVTIFENDGSFDIVLLDLSMPVLDGVGATIEIREIEERRRGGGPQTPVARILALTGMSSLEDKRRAFEAGVDGYLVKPVAFKALDEMFHKLLGDA